MNYNNVLEHRYSLLLTLFEAERGSWQLSLPAKKNLARKNEFPKIFWKLFLSGKIRGLRRGRAECFPPAPGFFATRRLYLPPRGQLSHRFILPPFPGRAGGARGKGRLCRPPTPGPLEGLRLSHSAGSLPGAKSLLKKRSSIRERKKKRRARAGGVLPARTFFVYFLKNPCRGRRTSVASLFSWLGLYLSTGPPSKGRTFTRPPGVRPRTSTT